MPETLYVWEDSREASITGHPNTVSTANSVYTITILDQVAV